jgi:hypothetical protein
MPDHNESDADLCLDGTLCQECGTLFGDLKPKKGNVLLPPPGHPRTCKACKREAWRKKHGR